MSKYLISGDPVRLIFPDGEFVDLKSELSQADSDYIASKMFIATAKVDARNQPEAEVSFAVGKLAALERRIMAWSFSEDGKPLPLTLDNISNLQSKYRSLIIIELNELDKQANEFSKN